MKTNILWAMIVMQSLFGMREEHVDGWNAKQYHTYAAPTLAAPKSLLGKLPLQKYQSILDLGCGSGEITAWVAEQNPNAKVLGIDPSQNMISFAQNQYKHIENLSFKVADALTLCMHNNFDFIFSCNAFHLIPEHQQAATFQALKKLAVSDRQSALCIIMAARLQEPEAITKAYATLIQRAEWAELQKVNLHEYFYPQDAESITPFLKQADFIPLELSVANEIATFKNKKTLKKFIASWMTGFEFIARMDKEKQKKFLNELVDEYASRLEPSHDGSMIWQSPRFVVRAERNPIITTH